MAKWSYNEAAVKAFADAVSANLTDVKSTSGAQAGGNYSITLRTIDGFVPTGYYFIKETSALTGAETYTDYLLNISGAANIEPKNSAPSVILHVNYMPDATYVDATDLQVGALAYYKAEIKMPSLISDYKQFHLHLDLTFDAGLEMIQDIALGTNSIYIQHASGIKTPLTRHDTSTEGSKYTIAFNAGKCTIDMGDLLTKTATKIGPDDVVVIKYAASVNKNAVMVKDANDVAGKGNESTITVKFSNDMNEAAPGDIHAVKTGTISDSASVYTYQVEFTKIDSLTKHPLAGAKFILYRDVIEKDGGGNDVVVPYYAVIKNGDTFVTDGSTTDGSITGWDKNKANAVVFTSSAVVNSSGNVTGGNFTVKGLDSLTYELEEVAAPSGYNKMLETVPVAIRAEITNDVLAKVECTADGGSYSTATDTVNGAANLNVGMVKATINNTPGSTLPATGGIGTTIFYIVGAVLLLGSSVIFIMKKKNEA